MKLSGKSIGGALGAVAGSFMGNPGAGYTFGSGIGGLFDSSTSAQKTWQNQFNAQTAWEKEKMQNAHQWEMQDLLKTGLNPALTAGGQGAMNATAPNPGEFTGAKESSATANGIRIMELANIIKKTDAETKNIQAQTQGTILNNDIVRKYGDPKAKQELANMIISGGLAQANSALATQQAGLAEANKFLAYHGQVPYYQEQSAKTREETKELARGNRYDDKHPYQYGINRGYNYFRPIIQDTGLAIGTLLSAKKLGGIAKAIEKTKVTEKYNKKGKFVGANKSWYE